MKLDDVYEVLDAVAPKALSDEYCRRYDAYDNSGVLIDTGKEVNGILFTLDLTDGALERALQERVNLIVTHHPVIYGKIAGLTCENPMDGRLMRCIQAGISVISMHLNLDTAKEGIDESLADAVRLVGVGRSGEETLMHPLSAGGYGRAYDVQECDLDSLAEGLRTELGATRMQVYPAKEKVKRAVSCCGAGADEGALAFAKAQGADVVISSDFKHHLILGALERGISVISPTHYASENYGFKKYYEKISKALAIPCVLHEDTFLL